MPVNMHVITPCESRSRKEYQSKHEYDFLHKLLSSLPRIAAVLVCGKRGIGMSNDDCVFVFGGLVFGIMCFAGGFVCGALWAMYDLMK